MNRCFSDGFPIIDHLNNGIARFCGNKNTVFNRTERFIRKFQNRICGNFSSRSGRAYTLCGNCGFCIYGNKLVFRCQCSPVKSIGRSRGRSDYKTCGNGALGAVGRTVDDGNAVLALLLRDISRRAAAVKVYRGDTARFKHYLRNFVH